MADTTAAKELLTFIERVERLEGVRKDAADDIAEVYKELVGRGFDKDAAKVIVKIRRTDDGLAKWTGASETVDFYLSALGMLPPMIEDRAPAHVRVENIEQFPAHDAETGEVFEPTQEQPVEPASQSETADQIREVPTVASAEPVEPSANEYAGTSSDENPAPNSLDDERPKDQPMASLEPHEMDRHAVTAGETAPIPHSPAVLPGKADKTSEAVTPPPASSLVANSDDDVPAFLKKDKQTNPDCQKPGNCKWDHSQISCSACQQAADQRRARAA